MRQSHLQSLSPAVSPQPHFCNRLFKPLQSNYSAWSPTVLLSLLLHPHTCSAETPLSRIVLSRPSAVYGERSRKEKRGMEGGGGSVVSLSLSLAKWESHSGQVALITYSLTVCTPISLNAISAQG